MDGNKYYKMIRACNASRIVLFSVTFFQEESLSMKMMILSVCFIASLFAQTDTQYVTLEGKTYAYTKPAFWDFITKAPQDFVSFGNQAFQRKNWNSLGWIAGSTALLLYYDQPIYDDISAYGRRIGIGNEDNTETWLSIDGFPIFRGPTDAGSAMYFIGDGWFHLGFSVGFWVVGEINDDNRALQTASQIARGMFTCGLSTQFLKHITGHETPNYASVRGGRWRWFPNQVDYHKAVPKYDAFPSGHVATASMTLTVIAENYPESKWIKPVGWSLIGLLSLQMINNGVHWASDYPLAIGMGYLFGKIAVESGRTLVTEDNEEKTASLRILPQMSGTGYYGLTLGYTF